MKANLKGGNIAVRFLLAHGEKLGMAGIAICVAMLIWSAIGQKRLGEDQQPEVLQELITRADAHIQKFRWDTIDEEKKLVAKPLTSGTMTDIPPTGFPPFVKTFKRSALDPVGLRTDPILLTAEDLEVNGDSGLWVFADPKTIEQEQIKERIKKDREKKKLDTKSPEVAREPTRGAKRGGRGGGLYGAPAAAKDAEAKRPKSGTIILTPRTGARLEGYMQVRADSWVTVLARIPIKQQYQEYDESLQNASGYNPERDVPDYFGYFVQRAEITDEGQGEWKKIAGNNGIKIAKKMDTYPVDMKRVIAPRYNHPILTHPLPPLILREWDGRASHSSMPLLSERDNSRPKQDQPAEQGKGTEEDDFFSDLPATERRGPGANARRPGPGGGRPTRGGPARGGPRRGALPVERAPSSGGGISQRTIGTALQPYKWDRTASHILFRYFDNTVKPGHKYRYRVRLVLKDVNNLSSEQYLDKTVVERRSKIKARLRPFRLTEWSKPSPVASVPLPARIYLVSAKTAKETNFNAEPEAELLIKALNSRYAAEIALADFFPRGSVINVHEKATVVWSNKFTAEQDSEFDFRTDVTLLDFSGGERLSTRNRNLTSPTRAVLMDASGRLFLQSELDDLRPVENYRQIISTGKDSR